MSSLVRSALCAVVLTFAGAAPVLALPQGQVSVAGSDVAQVHARIVHEAESLCRADYMPSIHSLRDLRRCVSDTTDDAVARSGRPDLIAYHVAHRGGDGATTVAVLR